MAKDNIIAIPNVTLVHETQKAWCIAAPEIFGEDQTWVPKSVCEVSDDIAEVEQWWFNKKMSGEEW